MDNKYNFHFAISPDELRLLAAHHSRSLWAIIACSMMIGQNLNCAIKIRWPQPGLAELISISIAPSVDQ